MAEDSSLFPIERDNTRQSETQSAFNLHYLKAMTDDTGLIQHGVGGVPDPVTGYTTDDNARAFLAMVRLWRAFPERRQETEPLLRRYLQFMVWTQLRSGDQAGKFVNFVSYDRKFMEPFGSDDCQGRCAWALGEAAGGPLPAGCDLAVSRLFHAVLPHVEKSPSPRATTYALLGIAAALPQDVRLLYQFSEPLRYLWETNQNSHWRWFEEYMTYDNARMVEAVHRAGALLFDDGLLRIAREAKEFLTERSFATDSTIGGYLEPVGCQGWLYRGGEKARFDQQTVEAVAYTELYRLFGDTEHEQISRDWFAGRNTHGLPLYDPDTGGCHDGITREGINRNQGAESILSFLLTVTG
jgi:hypothetical protein